MSSITPAIQTWAHDLDTVGIFDLLVSVESKHIPNRWPGTFLVGPGRDTAVTINPDEAFTWLCIDPHSECIHLRAKHVDEFTFEITGRHPLDRALALAHALNATVSESHLCLAKWFPPSQSEEQPGQFTVTDDPCEPEFPEPYTMYMKQELGEPAPGGELSPMGRMVALQVALRAHLRLAGDIDALIQGRAPALNAAIMQRGLLTEPEGRMAWDFNRCVDEIHQVLGAPGAHPYESSVNGTDPCELDLQKAPVLRRALLAIADSATGISSERLGSEASKRAGSRSALQDRGRQFVHKLKKLGWPIIGDAGPYKLEWHKLTTVQRAKLEAMRDSHSS